MKKIILTINILLFAVILSSCSLLDNFKTKYEVRFYHDSTLVKEEKVVEGSYLKAPTLEINEGYELDGWYQDLDDLTTKWDFLENSVQGNLELRALIKLKDNYLEVTNFSVKDNILSWNNIEGASYLVNDQRVSTNEIDLKIFNLLPLKETEIKVKALKENHHSLETSITITYYPMSNIVTQSIDMEAFDSSDFKELNRSQFQSSIIDMEDFYLEVKEGRLTSKNEKPKIDEVALILRQNGSLELKEVIDNFESLSFELGTYNENMTNKSTLEIQASNDGTNYVLIKEISELASGFRNILITKNDLEGKVLLNNLTFKLKTNITDRNIVIDNIVVNETVKEYYKLINNSTEDVPLSKYYETAAGLKGEALVKELRFIVSANLNPIKYSDIKEVLEFADANLDDEKTVFGIYDNKHHRANWGSRSEWHREHVWPNSRLGMDRVKENEVNQGSDPHNLRAITPSTNSSRSNRYYANGDLSPTGYTLPNNQYYPGDDHRGDVARILMYMVVRYEFLGLTDSLTILGRKAYTEEAAFMGLLSVLEDWHLDDKVDDFEKNRNEVIFKYQNNRNPFIDHPELFSEVFNYYKKIDEKNLSNDNPYLVLIDLDFFKKDEYNYIKQ